MEWFRREWANILTVGCITVAAIIEAWQQAISGAPDVAKNLPHLDGVWHYVPLCLLVAAGVSWLIGQRRNKQQAQGGALTQVERSNSLATSADKWDYAEFFRTAYYSPVQADVEKRARDAANDAQPSDREGFYLKVIGIGVLATVYDWTWFLIYGSQLAFLLELNQHNGRLPIASAKVHYDKAVVDYPAAYTNYTFDQWTDFMAKQTLIIRHPSDMIEITVRGKDFLKYLLHWGRDISVRKF
jgi:hypothetical protein